MSDSKTIDVWVTKDIFSFRCKTEEELISYLKNGYKIKEKNQCTLK